jgi:predicted nucleotidyltransferase
LKKTDSIIEELADRIKDVRGVSAVVLGGSRAIGTHTEESDIDIGIYYDPADPPDLAALGRLAADFDDEQRADALTPIGGWGPWINGGGRLTVRSVPVDFLYRDLRRVSEIRELSGYVIKHDNY